MHRGHGQAVSGEAIGVHPNTDSSFEAANDVDFSNAGRTLQLRLDHFVCNFGQFAQAAVARNCDGHDWKEIVVEFCDFGRIRFARKFSDDGGDAFADILGGIIDVPVEIEIHHDERRALARDGAEFANALDGVNCLFDLLRDFGFNFRGRGAGQPSGNSDGRHVHGRQTVDAEFLVTGRADHHQREHQH